MTFPSLADILAVKHTTISTGRPVGESREGRPILAHRFGTGPVKVSLLGGCHADEPVGPRFLRHLSAFLSQQSAQSKLISDFEWWIVPHINPDGERRNAPWSEGGEDAAEGYDLTTYLEHVARELPGDDIEFGFPRDDTDSGARPENRAVYAWWQTASGPFDLHVSLHGMAWAAGPWYLIEPAYKDRWDRLITTCRTACKKMKYTLHDMERHGEKGFTRIERGFCTRPDSRAMAKFFKDSGDEETAALFRPSSMETIRSFGGDPLTLVSEMPLFLLSGVGDNIEPTDPIADEWKEQLGHWKTRVLSGDEDVLAEIEASAVRSMRIVDQMNLQWQFIVAGIDLVSNGRGNK